jgi:hypothetical protein
MGLPCRTLETIAYHYIGKMGEPATLSLDTSLA